MDEDAGLLHLRADDVPRGDRLEGDCVADPELVGQGLPSGVLGVGGAADHPQAQGRPPAMRDGHRPQERVDPLVLGAGADPQQLVGVATRLPRRREVVQGHSVRDDGERNRHGLAVVRERRGHPIGLGLADGHDPCKAEELAVGGSRLRPAKAIAKGRVVLGDDERDAQLGRQRQRRDAVRQPVVGVDHIDRAAGRGTPRGERSTERKQRGGVACRHLGNLGSVEGSPRPDHR